jgi:NTE family protein
MKTTDSAIAAVLVMIVLCGCAHYPENNRLNRANPNGGYRFKNLSKGDNSDSLQMFLAFSGGGKRAAAFAYGVLEELAQTEITWEGQTKTLADEIDYISAVSGGSFTAAYFALNREKIFCDFAARFLNRNVQRDLGLRFLSPVNWVRLASPNFNRSDMAAEYYDREIFDRAKFADLLKQNRKPFLSLNATDMSLGATFQFTQAHFDFICSDLSDFPIGRAVAASSAFPILLSPITLNNYAGGCNCMAPEWMKAALTNHTERSRRSAKARELQSYQNLREHPYLHLLDGGLADNLGLRGPYEDIVAKGGVLNKVGEDFDPASVRKMVIIVVNSAMCRDRGWDRRKQPPSAVQVTVALGAVPMHRYSFETLELLKESVDDWEAEWNNTANGHTTLVKFYVIEVSLDLLPNSPEKTYLENLTASLSLPAKAIMSLRDAARTLLQQSDSFQALLEDLRE